MTPNQTMIISLKNKDIRFHQFQMLVTCRRIQDIKLSCPITVGTVPLVEKPDTKHAPIVETEDITTAMSCTPDSQNEQFNGLDSLSKESSENSPHKQYSVQL